MRLASLLLVIAGFASAAPAQVTLLEDLVRLKASESRNYEFSLKRQKAELEIGWHVREGDGDVRILVRRKEDADPILDSGYEKDGEWRVRLPQAGDYILRVENQQQRSGYQLVDLRLTLLFSKEQQPAAAIEAPLARRYGAILVSFALFFACVAYAFVRLRPAVQKRLRQ